MIALTWQKHQNILVLTGVLDQFSLISLWQHYHKNWDNAIATIDVAQLEHVDSAGLALLTYYITHYSVTLTGITPKLAILIELYNLTKVLELP